MKHKTSHAITELFPAKYSKIFLPILKSKVCALLFQNFSKLWRPTEKHSHFALPIVVEFLEGAIPVWSSSDGSCFQSGYQVSF